MERRPISVRDLVVAERPTLAVFGAKSDDALPGLSDVRDMVEIEFATAEEELARVLEHAHILLGWDFRAGALERVWSHARRLEWVHWAGAGVDAVLFPGLRDSNVILTNARGIFDWAIAEYVLGLVLCLAKGFPRTVLLQREKRWDFRHAESIRGRAALLVGAGNIGSAIGQLLRSAGMQVIGVARSARDDDPVFGEVHALAALDSLLESADYVVNVTPSTPATRGLFSAQRLRLLKPDARFINVGRGDAVDENALAAFLSAGRIAGAALDVFADEPLPDSSPLWELDNLIVSPHMSGDVKGSDAALIAQFADNLGRFLRGEPLENVVDKRKGY
jgi:phosphoglycerate dehydrogenase-like enzyme